MTNKGILVVFSGPSGTGKGTVLKEYFARHPEARLSISATTRAPRPGEENGREYYFVSREKFEQMRQNGELLESAEYCGNYYGTPRAPIANWLNEGHDVFLEIEIQGGAQVQKLEPDSVGIFVLPPTLAELERRLRGRGTETEAVIQNRLKVAKDELHVVNHYTYAVINDTVENAAERIACILAAEKCRVSRETDWIERVLIND